MFESLVLACCRSRISLYIVVVYALVADVVLAIRPEGPLMFRFRVIKHCKLRSTFELQAQYTVQKSLWHRSFGYPSVFPMPRFIPHR